MKKKKRLKFKKKKGILYFLILYIFIFILIPYTYSFGKKIYSYWNKSEKYTLEENDKNENYPGIGKSFIQKEEGYISTFTTTNNQIYKEYKQNGYASWINHEYWDGIMADNGCGITSVAIILSGYNINYTPEDLRQRYYPVMSTDGMSYELTNIYGIKNSNFYYDASHLTKESIIKHLKTNRPILVCLWSKNGSNRWTSKSHFMVLLATDGEKIYVSNPNGLEKTNKKSGWYNADEIVPYLAKALYIESYNDK